MMLREIYGGGYANRITHLSSSDARSIYGQKLTGSLKAWQKAVSIMLCILMLCAGLITSPSAVAVEPKSAPSKVADIDTSGGYVNLMANELYENATTSRYAGRVWANKSVFTDGNVNMDEKGFTNDSDFLVAGSFLGSTRSIVGNESQPIDLMVILDRSSSMAIDYSTDSEPMNDRMHHAVGALNQLFNQVKAHNENSRISLVAYSTETVTSLPLNTCTWEGNMLTAERVPLQKRWDAKVNCDDKNVQNFSTSSGTYTQRGLYAGMKAMSEVQDTKVKDNQGNYATRKPVVILVTDGEPQQFMSENWWEPGLTSSYYSGNNMGNTAAVFGSILTGAYWKKNVDANYGISSNVYTIGVDLTNPNGQYYQTVLDPGNGLKRLTVLTVLMA